MAKLEPLGDRVVVKALVREEVTKSGIVLPDTAKDKPKEGTVVAVGTGRVLDNGEVKAPEVKVGERILFGAYAGSEVKVGTEEYLILNESEILAVVENGKKK